MANAPLPPIIIKKKISHGGHHGGAWKVAYADFVTAMMALFIVLWLMNSNQKVQEAVGGYFRDPSGKEGKSGSGHVGMGEGIAVGSEDLHTIKEKLESALKQAPELKELKDQIEMTVTGEGLRVELLENETGTFFMSGSAKPTKQAMSLLILMGQEVGKLTNRISVEGHSDAKPFASGEFYSNWELSSDRANMARRIMQENGLRPTQIAYIRGFADQHLRKPDKPLDPSNRRISVIVQWDEPKPKAPSKAKDGHPVQVASAATPASSGHEAPKSGHAAPATDHGAPKHEAPKHEAAKPAAPAHH